MRKIWNLGLTGIFCLLFTGIVYADYYTKYEVTITNLTRGQTFTPQLVSTHDNHVSLFKLGQPASLELEILAEAGDTAPLTEKILSRTHHVADIQTIPGLLGPGQSVTTTVEASRQYRYLSMAAMLIPTNDTFVAVDGLRLPVRGETHRLLRAYDAGTELNDQDCRNIPGPICAGAGHSPGPNQGDEGYVYVGSGFHSLTGVDSDQVLEPQVYDWQNPVALITVKRIH